MTTISSYAKIIGKTLQGHNFCIIQILCTAKPADWVTMCDVHAILRFDVEHTFQISLYSVVTNLLRMS